MGRGGGSFANHSKVSANAKWVHLTGPTNHPLPRDFAYFGNLGVAVASGRLGSITLPTVGVKALRNLAAGEEVFIRYPQNTCSLMEIAYEDDHVHDQV